MTGGTQVPSNAVSGSSLRSRLFYFNGGFFTQSQVRRILQLAGFDLKLGKPGPGDQIAVWGKSPTSHRGTTIAGKTGANLIHIEDALLRSILPGRDGTPPLGLTIDRQRPYFDSTGPSDLEDLLQNAPLDDAALLNRAKAAIARINRLGLSKYNDFDPDIPCPDPGYVLVIDQTRNDASITYGGGSVAHFREMLVFAQQDHPDAKILIKTHPETSAGHRQGHFGAEHLTSPRLALLDAKIAPQRLLENARAVYTVSSGMGFEAIMAGHKPVVFGQPFYAGWGLTQDHQPIDRRQRTLTRAQLFAAAMILYPKWYDPYRDALCELEQVIDTLEALCRAHQADRTGYVALGMSTWKHKPLQKFFGPLHFAKTTEAALSQDKPILVWASKTPPDLKQRSARPVFRVEDGFLRSRGLGAELIPPLSLMSDASGIYYDPRQASDLEALISRSPSLPEPDLLRAERLRHQLIKLGLSKYNLGGTVPQVETGARPVILVPGQVEDDASIQTGTSEISTNTALLKAVRQDFPDAFIIYKPHPDVEAGLRGGAIEAHIADLIATKSDPIALLAQVDRVATMTSLLGFEALIRDVPVTCYGIPFYAGWGLTDDRLPVPDRRKARPSLMQLIHACLIGYPRYFDPKTGLACPVEIVLERLATGDIPAPGPRNRLLSKLQSRFAGLAPLWRRKGL